MTADPTISPWTRWEELWLKASAAEVDPMFFDEEGPWGDYAGYRAICAAVLTTTGKVESWKQQWHDPEADPTFHDRLPRWPSTLEPIDRVYSGFFGLTALVAQPGTGKTMLALSSALQAAATGNWNVKFFGAEVDDDEINERYTRELTQHPNAIAGADFFEFRHVGLGQTLEDMVFDLLEIDYTLPVLVVWDSINSIVKLMGGDYLTRLNQLCRWAAFARKLSRGALSFLVVSETNKNGRSKGEALEYASDLCLYMTGKPDETAVDFHIEKARREQWISIPPMTRYWNLGRFYHEQQMQQIIADGRREKNARLLPKGDTDGEDLDLF